MAIVKWTRMSGHFVFDVNSVYFRQMYWLL